MTVREAAYKDIPALLAIWEEFFKASNFDKVMGISFDDMSSLYTIKRYIDDPTLCLFVAMADSELSGFIVGGVRPWILNLKENVAFELGFYVRPKHRKSRASIMLIRALEGWARKTGAKSLEAGSAKTLDGKRVSKFFERCGFKHILNGHIKRLEG